MGRIGVLISGGGTNLQALIDATENHTIDGSIELVISNQPDAYGLARAEKHGIPHVCITDDAEVLSLLKDYAIDIVVLAGYLKQIPADIIQAFPNRIVNVHPSLIPSFSGKGFYGLNVHQAALDRGVKVSGATVHLVNEDLDEGPILEQEIVPVFEDDTVETLQNRVLEVEHRLLVKAVANLVEGESN